MIRELKQYERRTDLSDRFGVVNLEADFFSDAQRSKIRNLRCPYQQNLALKKIIFKIAGGRYTNMPLDFWLINHWGGIKNYKQTPLNTALIGVFESELKRGSLSRRTSGVISSLSKLAAFIENEKFVIYDSRVIYALNWLILTTKPKGIKFFPMPAPRNTLLKQFDVNTIIRLIYKQEVIKNNNELFYKPHEAYIKYCSLIKSLCAKIYGARAKPYYMEMLLYGIADQEIYQDVIQRTLLRIQS